MWRYFISRGMVVNLRGELPGSCGPGFPIRGGSPLQSGECRDRARQDGRGRKQSKYHDLGCLSEQSFQGATRSNSWTHRSGSPHWDVHSLCYGSRESCDRLARRNEQRVYEASCPSLGDPGLPIEQAFKMVSKGVHTDTSGQQVPWTSSSLVSDFSFSLGPIAAVIPAPLPEPPVVRPSSRPLVPVAPQPAEPAKRDPSKDAPLIEAATKGDVKEVERLLDEGADFNTLDRFGRNALHWAVGYGHRATVQLLLDRGADINARDRVGCTALHWAAMCRDINGENVNGGDVKEIVRLLLERGADVNAKTVGGKSALDLARADRNKDIVAILENRRSRARKR